MSPSAASSPAGGAPCRSSHTWRAQTDRPGPHPGPQARRGEAGAVVTGSCRPGLGQLAHPHQLRAEEKGTGRGRTGWRLALRPGSWEPERLGFKSQLQTLLIQCLSQVSLLSLNFSPATSSFYPLVWPWGMRADCIFFYGLRVHGAGLIIIPHNTPS